MLTSIFKNPFRLFVFVGILALAGIWSGLQLPISLYPQTSRPVVRMGVSYAGLSAEEFIRKYGANIEYQLENIRNTGLALDHVEGNYRSTNVEYTITYDWKVSFEKAMKEVETIAGSVKGILPKESSDSVWVRSWNENAGFLAVSFFSRRHGLNELYNILEPLLGPGLKKIPDSKEAMLWNPESQEVSILLVPEKLALYGLLPGQVQYALESSLSSLTGGEIKIGQKTASFQIPTSLTGQSELENHLLRLPDGRQIHLKDIAKVSIGRSETQSRGFKTNGKESLILFADPKSGANVKRMAEDVLTLIKSFEASFPDGIEYRVLVDPSEFIRSSIQGLFKDVVLAALLAVLVLFLFIGNFKQVVTASIEIPLSMVIAFIVMYFTDMNLNLISLGGLALAAGMNVDASVVVMENIFSHQARFAKSHPGPLSFAHRFSLVLTAVREVAAPILLSITTTLIVFIPLAMTTDLTNAILGDLAKAVIYSHGVSGFVAIFFVPTIRLMLMKNGATVEKAPLHGPLKALELKYLSVLEKMMNMPRIKILAMALPLTLAVCLAMLIIPRLPKEIIGTPDTDWIFISVSAPQSSSNRQMENILQEVESKALSNQGKAVAYTFVQMRRKNNGSVMLRLKDKSQMSKVVKEMQALFTNTPEIYFYVDSWNPAELPLPSMYHLDLKISGKKGEDVRQSASRAKYFIDEKGDYKRINVAPSGLNEKIHRFVPYEQVWSNLEAQGANVNLMDVLNLTVFANYGKSPGSLMVGGELIPINMKFEDDRFTRPELLAAYPLKINNKVIPLAAFGHFETISAPTQIYRRDGREEARITSTLDKGEEGNWEELAKKYSALIAAASKELTNGKDVVLEMQQPQKELLASLEQIKTSLGISLVLIFLVLWLQFQSIRQVMVIMLAVPLGVIGALVALMALGSTLSLNSALGILLLNGIAVNNSILLVEVFNGLRKKGLASREAVLEACRSRLRPILITSLTTALGMLPIAFGLGDGGKILQPLGITVAYGLLFSTTATLIVIPLVLYRKEENLTAAVIDDPKTIIDLMQAPANEATEIGPVQ